MDSKEQIREKERIVSEAFAEAAARLKASALRPRISRLPGCENLLEEGKKFDATRERIRQIEAKALRKLKHPTRSEKLKSFNAL